MTQPTEITLQAPKTPPFEFCTKPVTWFVVLDQVRQQVTVESDAQLTDSIAQHGVLQPVGAKPDGKLAWGHRRLRCAIAARLVTIPTILLLKEMTEGEFLTLQMVENVAREALSQFDLWKGCERLLDTNKWERQQLAKALSLDPSTVTRILSPSRCPASAVEALKAGKINLAHTYAISRAAPEQMEEVTAMAILGASRDELERKIRKPSTKPSIRLSRVACKLESGVQVAVSGESLDLDGVLEALADAGKLARRTRDQGGDVKSFNALMKAKAGV